MTSLVIDSSIVLTWCFEDEATEASDELLEHLQGEAAAVPNLWHVEIANVLALAERRRRITQADTAEFITLLESLTIVVDEETSARALTRVLDLARTERLTAYDATYLELAMRLGIPLATQDRALADAAVRVGVSMFGTD